MKGYPMFIADMHCDSLSCVSASRGLVCPHNVSQKNPYLQAFAAFIPAEERPAAIRRAQLMRMFNAYLYETDRLGIRRILGVHDLIGATDNGERASIFTVEGGGGLFADSTELTALYNGGMRILGLCWDSNELATGAWDRSGGGLTSEGRKLALACEEIGITLDCSHLNDRSLDELMDITRYPVIATHSNFRSVCNSPRNLTDEQAKKIISRGGVIGLNLYPEFLSERDTCTSDDILRHVDYALELLGEGALGLGCDIDGTEGHYPEGFNEASSIHDRLGELLCSHYSSSVVERIMGLNVIDFLEGALG